MQRVLHNKKWVDLFPSLCLCYWCSVVSVCHVNAFTHTHTDTHTPPNTIDVFACWSFVLPRKRRRLSDGLFPRMEWTRGISMKKSICQGVGPSGTKHLIISFSSRSGVLLGSVLFLLSHKSPTVFFCVLFIDLGANLRNVHANHSKHTHTHTHSKYRHCANHVDGSIRGAVSETWRVYLEAKRKIRREISRESTNVLCCISLSPNLRLSPLCFCLLDNEIAEWLLHPLPRQLARVSRQELVENTWESRKIETMKSLQQKGER